jgi:hypothetical protein
LNYCSFCQKIGVFFLPNHGEKQGFFGGEHMGRALHAAGAELGIAEEFVAKRLRTDLADWVAAGGELVVFGWRRLASVERGH